MGRVQEGVVKLNQCKELLQAEVERRSELQTNLARVIFELSQAQSGLAQLKFDKENADRVS
jgi:phosphoglycerate-specific signal transduction histidine kinase